MKKIQIAAYAVAILLLVANLYMSFQMQTKLEQLQQMTSKGTTSIASRS